VTDFLVIAHRGASAKYPENTLLAFRKALEAGASWLELDVQLSADGELVVIHDEFLDRTTSGQGAVARSSLSRLRQLDAGLGEKIPLLTEVLDLAAGRAGVNIELKGAGTGEPVARLLNQGLACQRWQAADLLVSSLAAAEILPFAALLPAIRVAPIADAPEQPFWELAARLQAWSVHVGQPAVTAALVEKARQQGRKLLVYTVNDQATLRSLQQLGVAGVFTDQPELYPGR
jgi:glycerophosphoryl diester phosphodiesterase